MRGSRSRSWAVPERTHHVSTSEGKSSSHGAMALAPPFASPKKESILCMSDEHAVPSSISKSSIMVHVLIKCLLTENQQSVKIKTHLLFMVLISIMP